jgi:hypothetical protein
MKKIIALFLICQSFIGYTQNCPDYYFLQNNKTIEVSIYTKKGKENGKHIYTVSNPTKSANASVTSELFDKDGKSMSKGTNAIKCVNGALMMDIKMTMTEDQQKKFADAKAQSDNFIEYPAVLKEGDNLKDASLTMQMKASGQDETVDLNIINRKVVAKESVTSPAGTWDCYKITFTSKVKITMMGMGIPVSFDITEWFCPGFGVVKTESRYGTTLVTSIK